jgi:capsular polysaccharide transport system permease protein
MDGFPSPRLSTATKPQRLRAVRRYRFPLLFIALPTLLASLYYFGIAAPQYETEARFIIYSSHGGQMQLGGLGQVLGLSEGGNGVTSETFSVIDFMQSHDAVSALQQKLPLVSMFRSPQADLISRLWYAHPTSEQLLSYYKGKVTLTYRQETGITTLDVHGYTPQDAYILANTLLSLGEQRVNDYNSRVTADTVQVAQDEVNQAQTRIQKAEDALTIFREQHQDLNPELSGTQGQTLIAALNAQLAQARADLAQMQGYLRPGSPQMITQRNRINALQSEIAAQSGDLTSGHGALAPVLAQYQDLNVQLQFAQQNYTATEAALVTAREDAMKQQLFLIRVVEPNLAQQALFPKRFLMVGTILAGLLVAYGILWLLVAGVREHAI